jgi:hypothetical protein
LNWENVVVYLLDLVVRLLIDNGKDPQTEVVRLMDAHPLLKSAQDEVEEAIRVKFETTQT